MLSEEGIEFITKVGNLPDVKKALEPNVMDPLKLEHWMVRRVVGTIEIVNRIVSNTVDDQPPWTSALPSVKDDSSHWCAHCGAVRVKKGATLCQRCGKILQGRKI